ncbi:ROK family protein [bacterium]|nr:ROK family protein [bacterium]
MADAAIVVDLGGTSIKSGYVTRDKRLHEKGESPTGNDLSAPSVARRIAEIIEDLAGKARGAGHRVPGAGVGVPGGIRNDRATVSQSPNFPAWQDVDIRSMIAEHTGVAVQLENDANLAALGEYWAGGGRDYETVVLYTLGTGVGGGIVLEGRIWRGAFGMAGELGHTNINPDGPFCGCGSKGCLEAYAGRDAIVRLAWSMILKNRARMLVEQVGGRVDQITPKDIHDAARAGCPDCRAIFEQVGRYVGIAAASLLNTINMEVLLVGGGISNAFDLIEGGIRDEIGRRAFVIPAQNMKLAPAQLGNDAGLMGAACQVLAASPEPGHGEMPC